MTSYDHAVVDWSNAFTIDELDELDHEITAHFYALVAATLDPVRKMWTNLDLLYIGLAYHQHVAIRVSQDHTAYSCVNGHMRAHPKKRLIVMAGTIVRASLERISQQFVHDVECCLIYCNQPKCNVACKGSYARRALVVENTGDYVPLHESCDCGA